MATIPQAKRGFRSVRAGFIGWIAGCFMLCGTSLYMRPAFAADPIAIIQVVQDLVTLQSIVTNIATGAQAQCQDVSFEPDVQYSNELVTHFFSANNSFCEFSSAGGPIIPAGVGGELVSYTTVMFVKDTVPTNNTWFYSLGQTSALNLCENENRGPHLKLHPFTGGTTALFVTERASRPSGPCVTGAIGLAPSLADAGYHAIITRNCGFTADGVTTTLTVVAPDGTFSVVDQRTHANEFFQGFSFYESTDSFILGATQLAGEFGEPLGKGGFASYVLARMDVYSQNCTMLSDSDLIAKVIIQLNNPNLLTPSAPVDADGDGFMDINAGGTDCNDADAGVFPGATEVCDHKDNNCDGVIDEGTTSTFHRDGDADGYVDLSFPGEFCSNAEATAAGFGQFNGINADCNDANAAVIAGMQIQVEEFCVDTCNGTNGQFEREGFITFCVDADGDKYGVPSTIITVCTAPAPGLGYVEHTPEAIIGSEESITDNDQTFPDNDGDGVLNDADLDDDNDGLSDVDEAATGTDPFNPDTDGDGVLDGLDNAPLVFNPDQRDTDLDGIADVIDSDDDNDGLADGVDNCSQVANADQADLDGDGLGDACDPDVDNDGVRNEFDGCSSDANKTAPGVCGCGVSDADLDGDGSPDCMDQCSSDPSKTAPGVCGCGASDADSDGDGIADCVDACPNDAANDADGDGVCGDVDNCPVVANADQADLDGDGLGDACDTDDDNDGVADAADAFPLDSTESVDSDGDGIGNNADLDDDNDGVADAADAFPLDPTESVDSDGDGIGNNADTDDDGDGYSDADELLAGSNPLDAASRPADLDGDGIPDFRDDDLDGDGVLNVDDAFPLDRNESVDTDGDGIGNNADTDDDGDNYSDADEVLGGSNPLDAASRPADLDNDGIPDFRDDDLDGDGVLNVDDAFPFDPAESVDTDGDGVGNNADPDDDNDGVIDAVDVFPLDRSEHSDNDLDGIGDNADPDDDNDGEPDRFDAFPKDSSEQHDSDGDGIGNNADPDDDNDGFSDADEIAAGTDPLDPNSKPGAAEIVADGVRIAPRTFTRDKSLANSFIALVKDTELEGATVVKVIAWTSNKETAVQAVSFKVNGKSGLVEATFARRDALDLGEPGHSILVISVKVFLSDGRVVSGAATINLNW